jgi:hypothetical protein
MRLNESIVEDAALTWFGEMGYAVGHGPQIAPPMPSSLPVRANLPEPTPMPSATNAVRLFQSPVSFDPSDKTAGRGA